MVTSRLTVCTALCLPECHCTSTQRRAVLGDLLERMAVDRMHHHPLAAVGDADDPLARHRLAALRELEALARIEADDGAARVDHRRSRAASG